MAAPSKLTDEVIEAVCKGLELGLSRSKATVFAGVSYSNFKQWFDAGGRPDNFPFKPHPRYAKFRAAVLKAEANLVKKRIKIIEKIGDEKQDWKASAWLLERRFPEEFSLGPLRVIEKDSGGVKKLADTLESLKVVDPFDED